jgi:hypothetical protein
MTAANSSEARQRVLRLANQIAEAAPQRQNKYAFAAQIPWRLIKELRAALKDYEEFS